VSAVRDERHKLSMSFVVEVFMLSKAKERFLAWWFNKFTDATRRKRLHGWRMWREYWEENSYEPSNMSQFDNPAMVVADFIASLEVIDTQIYLIKEAVTSVVGGGDESGEYRGEESSKVSNDLEIGAVATVYTCGTCSRTAASDQADGQGRRTIHDLHSLSTGGSMDDEA
jgi:hypothetical protein